MEEIFQQFSLAHFFSTYWRREPVLIKGGAHNLLAESWTDDVFNRALTIARQPGTESMVRVDDPDTATFVERATSGEVAFTQRLEQLGCAFGTPTPWCNAVRTYSRPSGIGSHYDRADNFVTQQSGTKEWRLAPPDEIPLDDYARRMLLEPGVGHQELLSRDVREYTLEVGDVLYIPLMWLHSGVSTGRSLSLTLLFPALTVNASIVSAISRVMFSRRLGYEPVDANPSWVNCEVRTTAEKKLHDRTRSILAELVESDVVSEIWRLQRHQLSRIMGET